MIIESDIKSLKEERVNLKDETVESSNAYLPKLYMCSMFIGAKGTGKTYSLVSLLKHYEKSTLLDKKGRVHKMRTILFCPTGNSDFNKFSDLPKANYEYLHFVENLRSFLTGSHDLIL